MTIKETLINLRYIVDNIHGYSDFILSAPVIAEIKQPDGKDVYKYYAYETANDYIYLRLYGSGGKPPMTLGEFIMRLASISEGKELITLDGLYRTCFISKVEIRIHEVVLLGSLEEED